MNRILSAIKRRLDAEAIEQLRTEVLRLDEENARLRDQLALAEQDAASWRDDALGLHRQLAEQLGGQPGVTKHGQLVVVARA